MKAKTKALALALCAVLLLAISAGVHAVLTHWGARRFEAL